MIIKAISDNGGTTYARYCVYFWMDICLSLSDDCDTDIGVSLWTEHTIPHEYFVRATTENKPLLAEERLIDFDELPKNVQNHVIKQLDDKVYTKELDYLFGGEKKI